MWCCATLELKLTQLTWFDKVNVDNLACLNTQYNYAQCLTFGCLTFDPIGVTKLGLIYTILSWFFYQRTFIITSFILKQEFTSRFSCPKKSFTNANDKLIVSFLYLIMKIL